MEVMCDVGVLAKMYQKFRMTPQTPILVLSAVENAHGKSCMLIR